MDLKVNQRFLVTYSNYKTFQKVPSKYAPLSGRVDVLDSPYLPN